MTNTPPATLPVELAPLVEAFARQLAGSPKLSPNTRKGYVTRLRGYLRWLDAAVLDGIAGDALTDPRSAQQAVVEYRSWMLTAAKRSPNTVNAHLTAVEAFYAWRGIAVVGDRSPVVPQRRALDPAERRRLDNYLATATEPGEDPDAVYPLSLRDQAVLRILRYTGLRIAEAADLDLDDLVLTDRTGAIKVRSGKGSKPRDIPIAPRLRPTLWQYRTWRHSLETQVEHHRGVDGGGERHPLLVGVRRPYRRLGDDGIAGILTGVAAATGIDDLTAHVLRHTMATELREHDIDRRIITALLGHATSTTDLYTTPSWDDLVQALAEVYPPSTRRRKD